MSLITEALKKAQRARSPGLAPEHAPGPAGAPVAKRGKSLSTTTVVLIGSGAVVLVVLSVVLTVLLLHRSAPPAPAPVLKAAPELAPTTEALPAAIVTPLLPAAPEPRPEPPPPPAPAPTSAAAAATPAEPKPARPTLPPAATVPPAATAGPSGAIVVVPGVTPPPRPAAPTPPPTLAQPDERIAAFIESVRISGLRAMGTESRVLINERVYRVNDVVERTLGIRLVKVEADRLTFVDANGVTYVKYF